MKGIIHDIAVRTSGGIAIDCTSEGDFYLITLEPDASSVDKVIGTYQKGRMRKGIEGSFQLERFENAQSILYVGEWPESGNLYRMQFRIGKAELLPNNAFEGNSSRGRSESPHR